MSDKRLDDLARAAYEAFQTATSIPLRNWDQLDDRSRQRWRHVAFAVMMKWHEGNADD